MNWRMRRKLVENNKTKNIINSFFHVHCLLNLHMYVFPRYLQLSIWSKLQKMESTEKQLEDMLIALKSRSKEQVILESVSFVFLSLLMLVWKLFNSLGHVTEPSIANNSKYVRGVACCFRFLYRGFDLRSFRHSHIGDISLAVQWCNLPVQGYIVMALVAASVHTLALMAVNRYFRIVKPSKYRRYFTKKKTMMMLLVSWFYSICCPLPYFLSGHKTVFLATTFSRPMVFHFI